MFNQEYVRECFGSVWALLMKINYKMVSEMVVRFKFTIIHFKTVKKFANNLTTQPAKCSQSRNKPTSVNKNNTLARTKSKTDQ